MENTKTEVDEWMLLIASALADLSKARAELKEQLLAAAKANGYL